MAPQDDAPAEAEAQEDRSRLHPIRALVHVLHLAPGDRAELPYHQAKPLLDAGLIEDAPPLDADTAADESGESEPGAASDDTAASAADRPDTAAASSATSQPPAGTRPGAVVDDKAAQPKPDAGQA